MSETLLLGLALFGIASLPFYLRARRRERASEVAHAEAVEAGLHLPVTLHPVIDPERCIGSGGCVSACPEHVIGFRNGQAFAAAPACCIGHGACERACPVGAIQLVIGTATRGVELPRLREGFETNVPGLHVIGELGGMGLIRNAFEHGMEAIARIAARLEPRTDDVLDLVVVGAGPAGLAASLHALDRGLRFVAIEKEDVGGTVRHYPRHKLVMSDTLEVPRYGRIAAREIRKEELVALWQEVVMKTGLQVRTGEQVLHVERDGDGVLHVRTPRETLRAQHVVLAIGRRGVPRKLGVLGEASAHVAYAVPEPEQYTHEQVVVVGGGDSAVEAALALAAQPGNVVRLSYRGERLVRVKPGNRARFEEALADGRVTALWQTNVAEIGESEVVLRDAAGGLRHLPATRVFILVGGELPTPFLRACGIEIETKFGAPLR